MVSSAGRSDQAALGGSPHTIGRYLPGDTPRTRVGPHAARRQRHPIHRDRGGRLHGRALAAGQHRCLHSRRFRHPDPSGRPGRPNLSGIRTGRGDSRRAHHHPRRDAIVPDAPSGASHATPDRPHTMQQASRRGVQRQATQGSRGTGDARSHTSHPARRWRRCAPSQGSPGRWEPTAPRTAG
jgi:hypothetical protein